MITIKETARAGLCDTDTIRKEGGNMNLEKLYHEVDKAISGLDLKSVWPGFEPLRFALYDDEKCFFAGEYIEKTDAFCANTSIVYEGEQIAIWKVSEALDIPVLTSKLVHEMFHGFQTLKGWDCWPDEIEALFRYEYDAKNLSIKLRENELLLGLLDGFDGEKLKELLSLRKLRSEKYPYQFMYEVRTEEIEGTANYVEWQVLKRLDEGKARELTGRMRAEMTDADRLFPIRISCYYTGALMINALTDAKLYRFDPPSRPAVLSALEGVSPSDGSFDGGKAVGKTVAKAVAAFNEKTESIISSALEKNEVVLKGPLELAFVNIYNARCRNGFLTSDAFLMYRDGGENRMIPGSFVLKMRDEKTIDTVYKWDNP